MYYFCWRAKFFRPSPSNFAHFWWYKHNTPHIRIPWEGFMIHWVRFYFFSMLLIEWISLPCVYSSMQTSREQKIDPFSVATVYTLWAPNLSAWYSTFFLILHTCGLTPCSGFAKRSEPIVFIVAYTQPSRIKTTGTCRNSSCWLKYLKEKNNTKYERSKSNTMH